MSDNRNAILAEIKELLKLKQKQEAKKKEQKEKKEFKPEVGKKLRPKEYIRLDADSVAEIKEFDPDEGWWIVIDDKFGHRYKTAKEIEDDFEEL